MSTHSVTNNDVDTHDVSGDSSRVTGCVKWFNNKAGYGFITVSSGPHAGDVFVHHSAVNVGEEQYRFLVQGEYVEFHCVSVDSGPHQWQAANVTGPNSGRLMCETRRTVRSTRPEHDGDEQSSRPPHREHRVAATQEQRPRRAVVSHGHRAPRQAPGPEEDGYEWLLVRKVGSRAHGSQEQSAPRGVRPQRVERSERGPRRVMSVVGQHHSQETA